MTTKPVDYSKPVGWACSRGVTWRSARHHAEECWGDLPCLSRLIPVYLPLPVPEEAPLDDAPAHH